MKKASAIFHLVRHGETVSNIGRIVEGHTDSELTPDGVLGAEAFAQELGSVHFDAVFSSDLPRTLRTVEILTKGRDLPFVATPLLRERNFGIFEGKPRAEYAEATKELAAIARAMPRAERNHFRFHESVESRAEMIDRLLRFFGEAASVHPNGQILVSTHGGMFLTIFALLGDETEYQISNVAMLVIESDGQEVRLVSMKGITPREKRPDSGVAQG